MAPAAAQNAAFAPDLMVPGWRRSAAERAPMFMALYVLAIFLFWVVPPTSLAVDETQQMVMTQVWSWGYGGQLPLYTWLQIAVFEITGPGKLGLAVLKYGLFLGLYLGMYVLARRMQLGPWGAAIAMVGMLAIPTLIWSAQRDLTHTVLMATLCVWAMIAAVHAIQSGRIWAYALFGACLAAGLLSKWNFAVLAAGMLGAAAMLRLGKPSGFAVALAVMGALLAMPALWALQNTGVAFSASDRLSIDGGPGARAALTAVAAIAEGAGTELLVLSLLSLWAFGALLWTRRTVAFSELQRFVILSVGLAAALTLGGILASGMQNVNPRWLLPITLFLPLLIALKVEWGLTQRRGVRFLGGILALAVVFGIAAPQAILWASPEPPRRMAPFTTATEVLVDRAPAAAFVGGLDEAGDIRAAAGIPVITPNLFFADRLPTPEVVVWSGTAPQPLPSDRLRHAFSDATGLRIDTDRIIERRVPHPGPYAGHDFFFYMAEVTE